MEVVRRDNRRGAPRTNPGRALDPMAGISLRSISLVVFVCVCYAILVMRSGASEIRVHEEHHRRQLLHLRQQLQPDVDLSDCRLYLAISDLNQNDGLDSDPEYLRFLNYWTEQGFSGDTRFMDLPAVLRENFDLFASESENEISLSGAKPGSILTEAQRVFLENVCRSTQVSLGIALEDDMTGIGGQQNPTMAPNEIPSVMPPTGQELPTQIPQRDPTGVSASSPLVYERISSTECRIFMAVSDRSRDDSLSPDEYTQFINRVGGTAYESFDRLTTNIQATFNSLTAPGEEEIDIFGSRPGQDLSQEQELYLERVCLESENAFIETINLPVATPAPDSNTDIAPQVGPALSPVTAAPDGGSPIIAPVSSPIASPTVPAVMLPPIAPPVTTTTLVPSAAIPTQPSVPDNNRLIINSAFVIYNTAGVSAIALNDPDNSNTFGLSIAYDRMVQGVFEGSAGQMVASKAAALTGAATPSGRTQVEAARGDSLGLGEAWKGEEFHGVDDRDIDGVSQIVGTTGAFISHKPSTYNDEQSGNAGQKSESENHEVNLDVIIGVHKRVRNLEVLFVTGSPAIDNFVVSPCPLGNEIPRGAICHTVYASYDLEINNTEDSQLLSNRLVADTQQAIDQGNLQKNLEEADPDSVLTVTSSSYPVTPETSAPSAATASTPVPTAGKENDATSGLTDDQKLYIVIGSVLSAALLALLAACVLCVGCYLAQINSMSTNKAGLEQPAVRRQDSLVRSQLKTQIVEQFDDEEIGMDGDQESPDFNRKFELVEAQRNPKASEIILGGSKEVESDGESHRDGANEFESDGESHSDGANDSVPPPPPPPFPPVENRRCLRKPSRMVESTQADSSQRVEHPPSGSRKQRFFSLFQSKSSRGQTPPPSSPSPGPFRRSPTSPSNKSQLPTENNHWSKDDSGSWTESARDDPERKRKNEDGEVAATIENFVADSQTPSQTSLGLASHERSSVSPASDGTSNRSGETNKEEEESRQTNVPAIAPRRGVGGDDSAFSNQRERDEIFTPTKIEPAALSLVKDGPTPHDSGGQTESRAKAETESKAGPGKEASRVKASDYDTNSSQGPRSDEKDAKATLKPRPPPGREAREVIGSGDSSLEEASTASDELTPIQKEAKGNECNKGKEYGRSSSDEESTSEVDSMPSNKAAPAPVPVPTGLALFGASPTANAPKGIIIDLDVSSDEDSSSDEEDAKAKQKPKPALKKKVEDSDDSSSEEESSDEEDTKVKQKPKPAPNSKVEDSDDSSSEEESSDEEDTKAKQKPKPAPRKKIEDSDDSSSEEESSDEEDTKAKQKPKPAPRKKIEDSDDSSSEEESSDEEDTKAKQKPKPAPRKKIEDSDDSSSEEESSDEEDTKAKQKPKPVPRKKIEDSDDSSSEEESSDEEDTKAKQKPKPAPRKKIEDSDDSSSEEESSDEEETKAKQKHKPAPRKKIEDSDDSSSEEESSVEDDAKERAKTASEENVAAATLASAQQRAVKSPSDKGSESKEQENDIQEVRTPVPVVASSAKPGFLDSDSDESDSDDSS